VPDATQATVRSSIETAPPSAVVTTVQTTMPPATTPTTAEDAALAAYVAGMDAFAEAVADPVQPEHPALQAAVVDPLLSELRNLAATWLGFGQAVRLPAEGVRRTELLDVEVTGDTAMVEVCSVDDSILYEIDSGRVLNDAVSTSRIRAEVRLVDGQWRLASRERLESWEGVAGCALT
jgi:hypothetical protein